MENGFGKRLRTYRTQLGLSVPQLAAMTVNSGHPLTESMIREIEAGRRREVGVATIIQLASLMRIPPVCLMVNHRDPFGSSDVPGMERMGLGNYEVSAMFDASIPLPEISGAWDATGEVRFAVDVNRHLHDLGMLRARNRLIRDQYQDFVLGRGHYAGMADLMLRRAGLEAVRGTGMKATADETLENLFISFFLDRGEWVGWRIRHVLRRLEALENAHGSHCSCRGMLKVCAKETEWVKTGRNDQRQKEQADPDKDTPPRAMMFHPKSYNERSPYQRIELIEEVMAGERTVISFDKIPDGYGHAYEFDGGVDVALYLEMAVALDQIAVDGTMLELPELYRRMNQKYRRVIKRRNLPPFESFLAI